MMPAPRKNKSAAHWEAHVSQWVKHLGEFKMARSAREAVRQGNHLLLLKESSPHGTWRNQVNALGLSASTASVLMAMERRFADAPDVFFDAVGSASKLEALLPLDDAEALMRGEEVHGLTLERIKPMKVSQLRAAVRAARGMACEAEPRLSARPRAARLSVDEERMLRPFRQCGSPAREALFSVAGLLAQP